MHVQRLPPYKPLYSYVPYIQSTIMDKHVMHCICINTIISGRLSITCGHQLRAEYLDVLYLTTLSQSWHWHLSRVLSWTLQLHVKFLKLLIHVPFLPFECFPLSALFQQSFLSSSDLSACSSASYYPTTDQPSSDRSASFVIFCLLSKSASPASISCLAFSYPSSVFLFMPLRPLQCGPASDPKKLNCASFPALRNACSLSLALNRLTSKLLASFCCLNTCFWSSTNPVTS